MMMDQHTIAGLNDMINDASPSVEEQRLLASFGTPSLILKM
jgi:hypothetical protein